MSPSTPLRALSLSKRATAMIEPDLAHSDTEDTEIGGMSDPNPNQ